MIIAEVGMTRQRSDSLTAVDSLTNRVLHRWTVVTPGLMQHSKHCMVSGLLLSGRSHPLFSCAQNSHPQYG